MAITSRAFRCSFNDEDDARFEIVSAVDAGQAAEIFASLMYARHPRLRRTPDWSADEAIRVVEIDGDTEPKIFDIEVVKTPVFLVSPSMNKNQ